MRPFVVLVLAVFLPLSFSAAQDSGGDASRVVSAKQAYSVKANKASRLAVLDSLEAYTGEPTVDTIEAALAVLSADIQSGKPRLLRESGRIVTAHLEPVATVLPQQYAEARFAGAVGTFNSNPKPESMIEMAHVRGFAGQFWDDDGAQPDWASDLRYRSEAWGHAMSAYFASIGKPPARDEAIDDVLAMYAAPVDQLAQNQNNISGDELPFCEGEMLMKPKLRYPSAAAMRGKFGAVIMKYEFDAEGKVINPKVLASVPIETFERKVISTVGKWRYVATNPAAVGKTCRLYRTNVRQVLTFQIGRR